MDIIAVVVAATMWLWPVQGPVVSPFVVPSHAYASGHRGVDIGAAPGAPIRAAHAGIVTHAAQVAGVPTLTVRDGSMLTTYQPVIPAVRAGTAVDRGDLLGFLGRWPGHCTCLHVGVRIAGEYRNPLRFLRTPVVLKSPRSA